MASGKGENLGKESWHKIKKKKETKHPVIEVKLKSYGHILGPFAALVGRVFLESQTA